jgi:hypothetical protein
MEDGGIHGETETARAVIARGAPRVS